MDEEQTKFWTQVIKNAFEGDELWAVEKQEFDIKVTLEFSKETQRELTKLATLTQQDWSDVFQNALRLYHEAVVETGRGKTLCFKDEVGNVEPWDAFVD